MKSDVSTWLLVIVLFTGTAMATARANEYTVDFDSAPANQFFDRWVYPFNVTPGSRIQAPTFGAVGSEGFDDRDGQMLLAIDTAAVGIPPGKLPSQYIIDSLQLTLTESVGGYRYDGSYDAFTSYLESSNPNFVADVDTGRPIELYGAGFRNGFDSFAFSGGSPVAEAPLFSAGSPFGSTDRGTRNIYAADANRRDVSNNVDSLNEGVEGFDPIPFAIGQAEINNEPLAAGQQVAAGTDFVFNVDVTNAAILQYIQDGLAAGQIGFMVTSLHPTGQMGAGASFVNLATSNHFAIDGPQFTISVTIDDTNPAIPGDVNGDGVLSSIDIDEIAAGATIEPMDLRYDVNRDSVVNFEDQRYWVEQLAGTYFGDANLDGEFNSSDFVAVFSAGQYEDDVPGNSNWSSGDWNGDREFDTKDFVLAFQASGYEQGSRSLKSVPEPSTTSYATVCLAITAALTRRAKTRTEKPNRR